MRSKCSLPISIALLTVNVMIPTASAQRPPITSLVVALCMPTAVQLPDLQPGRNFTTHSPGFGTSDTENMAAGDADNDGDLDIAVANGGDSPPQANQFYLNLGGAQAGVEGTFLDDTALRFQGVAVDASRDIEFVDWDGDADLDIFVSNHGPMFGPGGVSRAYRNQGGSQHGAVGFFSEDTDFFWGTLVGVPPADEVVVQDGMGPFRAFSCDCDFADLDDDGDLDLFHSNYGPGIQGNRDSRIFLNDGNGRFDELWPWADAAADTMLHTLDCDIADLDGDFDLDIIAGSRNSQSRIYTNNLDQGAWTTDPFTDITQTALLDTGAMATGTLYTYELEFGDFDSDGDFDIWMVNYNTFQDRILQNQGGEFHVINGIGGDPKTDENDVDFLDYDGDGDLDAVLANWSGDNYIYQSALMDGLPSTGVIFHRTGGGAGQMPPDETPELQLSTVTLDGECADLDGDGDTDIFFSTTSQNWYWENQLGIPDTHAPIFMGVTQQSDKMDGTDTIIHAKLHDNDPYYIIAFHDVDMIYTVNGGPETCVQMVSQGGQQFRAVIPGELSGTVAYRIEATDGSGNTGISSETTYVQTSSGAPLWQNLGHGTPGVAGDPYLKLTGAQAAGQIVTLQVSDAAPSAFVLLWLSFNPSPINAVGGVVYAFPNQEQLLVGTDAGGIFTINLLWPTGIPTGTEATWQAIVQDSSNGYGIVLSNAVKSTSP